MSPPPLNGAPPRQYRQMVAGHWCVKAFGPEHAGSVPQRAIRFLEEAVELFQAAMYGDDALPPEVDAAEMAHKLIDYVFSRPVGHIGQELGGVGVTVLLLANAADLDADECEAAEVARVLSKPPEHFHQRNEVKNAAGFDVTGGAYPTAPHNGGCNRDDPQFVAGGRP